MGEYARRLALDAVLDIVSPILFGDHGEARRKIYSSKKDLGENLGNFLPR